jgi:hypothetical protein
METYRIILITIVMILSLTDLVMTAIYIEKYKKWQPEKPYKSMELNPILVFLWNNLGFIIGMIIGSVILLSLNFIIAKNTYWLIPIILGIFIIFNIFNHMKNFGLLNELIRQYPSGHLPQEIFGKVAGNN